MPQTYTFCPNTLIAKGLKGVGLLFLSRQTYTIQQNIASRWLRKVCNQLHIKQFHIHTYNSNFLFLHEKLIVSTRETVCFHGENYVGIGSEREKQT